MLSVKLLIVEPSRAVLLVTFSVLRCLCPNFFWAFCRHRILLFFMFTIYNLGLSVKTQKLFSLYLYQLNKSDLTNYIYIYFFAFLERVPTFMEMGFVDEPPVCVKWEWFCQDSCQQNQQHISQLRMPASQNASTIKYKTCFLWQKSVLTIAIHWMTQVTKRQLVHNKLYCLTLRRPC